MLVQTLNPNKANGLDRISNRMLKSVSKTISKPLAILLNRSFSEGIFPKIWKMSGLVPIPISGLPQGSVLGPLLFLIYVNDIADSLLSLTRLFADDSSLFYSASSIDDIQGLINHDLVLLSRWAKQWLVTFNPSKTEAILFSLRNPDFMPLLKFEYTYVKFVENHKHLGLTLSYNGQWTDHIHNIKCSAAKVLGIMRKLKFSLSRSALNQIYFSYLLPTLEYAFSVWDGCTAQNADTLDKVQNEAARIVTGLTRSVSLDKLFKECGWLSHLERRRQQKLNFMFQVHQG